MLSCLTTAFFLERGQKSLALKRNFVILQGCANPVEVAVGPWVLS